MKSKKSFRIITITLLSAFFLIAALCIAYFSLINVPHHNAKIESGSYNNSYLNTYSNIMPRLTRVGDKLYYNASNDFFKYGTYEITADYAKRIYWEGPSLSGSYIDLDCASDKNLFSPLIENNIIEYYNLENNRYEEYLKISESDAENPKELFVVKKQVYCCYSEFCDYSDNFCSTYNLYRQMGNYTELILSVKDLEFDYISEPQFYDKYIYFIAVQKLSDKENSDIKQYVCKYDPDNREIIDKMICFEGSEHSGGIERFSCSSVVNDKIYGVATNQFNEYSGESNEYIYSADLKNKTSNLIFKSNGSTIINSYEDKVFICVENGKDKGIYSVDTVTDEVAKIFDKDMDINGLYIVDPKYLYFTDNAYFCLYRITQDGKTLEKVFG